MFRFLSLHCTRLELQNSFLSFKNFNDEPYLAENVYCITCDVGASLQLPEFQRKSLVSASFYSDLIAIYLEHNEFVSMPFLHQTVG